MELNNVWRRCLEKVECTRQLLQGRFPHITKDGAWLTNENGHWTGGFWTGLLWLKALDGGVEQDFSGAAEQAKRLAVRMRDNKTHDMGFIFGPSCVFGNNIRPDAGLVEMAVAGARNMVDLFEPRIGLVLAWDEPGYENIAIVDTIMNTPLLIWAAEASGDRSLHDTGLIVADTILKQHVRDDYSTYHVVGWDAERWAVNERRTHQGFQAESCWSRGQAWALYGFANMYRYTAVRRYLDASEKLADYFWDHLDDGLSLPRWDFTFRNEPAEPLDAAAASIAASGMALLSRMLSRDGEEAQAVLWNERAERIVQSLAENCLFDDLERYGIIREVTVDRPRNSGVRESSMYGDYYFMEALYRLQRSGSEESLELLY